MPDTAAPGLVLSPTASVGRDVSFGANVVVHDGVVIGDGVVVQDNVVLGKPPRLAPTLGRAAQPRSTPLVIEEGAAICARAIVFAGAHIGAGAIVGDQAYVRERAAIGADSRHRPRLRGRQRRGDRRARPVQTNVYVTGFSVVEDDVFLGPGVMTTNDDTMAPPRAPTSRCAGATLRRACRDRAAPRCSCPASRSARRRSSPPAPWSPTTCRARAVVMGVPARVIRHVPDEDLLEPGVRLPHLPRCARAGAGAPPAAARRAAHLGARGRGPVTGGAVAVTELGRVWRRGSAPLPTAVDDRATSVAAAGARRSARPSRSPSRGYRQGSRARERAAEPARLVHAHVGAHPRVSTHIDPPPRALRARSATSSSGRNHIHHFVPGIALAFLAGRRRRSSARSERLDRWLAIPFGTGVALTLDESALLLKLDDVYWTEEGIVSVQISLAVVSMLSAGPRAARAAPRRARSARGRLTRSGRGGVETVARRRSR